MRLVRENEKADRIVRILSVVLMGLCAALFLYTVVRYKPKPSCMEVLPYPIALVVLCWILRGHYGKRPVYWLGAAFVAWYGVTRLLIGDVHGRQAFYYFAEVAIIYLFAFPFARAVGEKGRLRVFDGLALGVVTVVTAACILGLCVVIGGEPISFSGGHYTTRLYENRLWLMALNPNIGSMFMVISLLLAVYLLLRYRKRWTLAVGIPVILIDYLTLISTDSRMAKLSLLGCAAVVGAIIASKWLKRRFVGRAAVIVVAAATATLVCYYGYSVGMQALNGGAAAYAERQARQEQSVDEQQTEETVQAAPVTELSERQLVDDYGSGRVRVYRCFENYLKDHPSVLLTGSSNLTIRLMTCYGMDSIQYFMEIHLHNSFFQTLAGTGVVGLVLVLAMCVFLLVYSLRVLFSVERSAAEKMLPVFLWLLIIDSVAESPLFLPYDEATNSFFNFFFFLCAGYVVELGRKVKKSVPVGAEADG